MWKQFQNLVARLQRDHKLSRFYGIDSREGDVLLTSLHRLA